MGGNISVVRLVAVVFATFAVLLPLYFLLIRDSGTATPGIEAARLLDTAPAGSAKAAGVDEGKVAQDFEISTPDARRIRLSELRGRPVLINFWATWCGSCLSEMPEIKALQAERGIGAFTVLAINAGETPDEAQEFIDFLEAPFVWALDLDLKVADAYGVYGLPLSVFIDSEGVIRAVYRGHANRERLAEFTDAAIAARPPGDFPVALRLISTIPRERVLLVTAMTDAEVRFSSRSLRCDPSYCSRDAIKKLEGYLGVRSATLDLTATPEPTLTVSFDPGLLSSARVVELFGAALGELDDTLYQSPIEIKTATSP